MFHAWEENSVRVMAASSYSIMTDLQLAILNELGKTSIFSLQRISIGNTATSIRIARLFAYCLPFASLINHHIFYFISHTSSNPAWAPIYSSRSSPITHPWTRAWLPSFRPILIINWTVERFQMQKLSTFMWNTHESKNLIHFHVICDRNFNVFM